MPVVSQFQFANRFRPPACLFAAAATGVLSLGLLCQQTAIAQTAQAHTAEQPSAESVATAEQVAEIAKLIGDLGDADYETRDEAHRQLAKLGPLAFDALAAAESSADAEVSRRATYLLRSLRIPWIREDDPADVRQQLRNYDALDTADRLRRIEELGVMPADVGTGPLCRIVRYEKRSALAKAAALMIVDRPPPEGETLERQRKTIRQTLGTSKRTAARWLQAYDRFFAEPDKALADWEQLLTEETAALANRSAEASTDQVFRLRKRQYAMLLARDRKDDAQNVIRQMVQLQPAETQALVAFIEWLTKAEAWSAIDELAKRHAGVFEKNPILVYALANAQLSAGKKEEAETTAARALTIRATEPMTHLVVANRLADMGLFTWAEREYRFVIDNSPNEARLTILAGLTLSAMFQDQEKYLEAAKAREVIVKKIDENPALREQLESSSSSSLAPKRIRAGMEYCYAMHYAAAGDVARQIEHLDKAAEKDPQDADVLIALYRLPNQDEKRRKATKSLIDRATRASQREIDEYEPLAVESEDFQGFLATKYNEYAWLVSNTYGDFDKALQYSIKSNEIHDNIEGGLLDTLGRCYYAKGDLENAIRTQARALQLDPHSGAIARQLAFFRAEKAKRDGAKGEAGAAIAMPPRATEP